MARHAELLRGMDLLNSQGSNKGTAFTDAERSALGLQGLLPPDVETLDQQPRTALQFAAFQQGREQCVVRSCAQHVAHSRAQHDLIDFTLLKACLEAGRLEEAQRLLGTRRPGASGIPVKGIVAVH